MAERELERAQKALRPSSDYYDDDDDDDSAGGGWMVNEEKKTAIEDDDEDEDQRDFGSNSNHSVSSTSSSLLFDHPFSEIPLDNNQNSKTNGGDSGEEAIIDFLHGTTSEGPANSQQTNSSSTAGAATGGGGKTNNIASFDPLVNPAPQQRQLQQQSQAPTVSSIRNLASRIPAPNSLFDDDDSTSDSVVMMVGAPSNSKEDGTVGVELSELGFLADGTTNTQDPTTTTTITTTTRASSSTVPGVAGFLEMEEEPPRDTFGFDGSGGGTRTGLIIEAEEEDRNYHLEQQQQNQIRTDSGLVLTHRKFSSSSQQQNQHPHYSQSQQHHPHQQNSRPSPARPFSLHPQHQPSSLPSNNGTSSSAPLGGGGSRGLQHDYFEEQTKNGHHRRSSNNNTLLSGIVERLIGLRDAYVGGGGGGLNGGDGKHSMAMLQARRLLSLVRVWIVIGAVFVLVTTGAFFHSLGHKELEGDVVSKSQSSSNQEQQQAMNDVYSNSNGIQVAPPQEILLLPLDDISKLSSQRSMEANDQQPQQYHHHHGRRLLMDLRQEFEAWVVQHNKSYHSFEEKEHRFSIWTGNHWRTHEKNIRHGPCRLTKQHVFGSNHFKDLSPEEFKTKYLTGYKGMRTDELDKDPETLPPALRKLRKDNGQVMNPNTHKINMHESVRERHLKYHPQAGPVFAVSSSYSAVSYGASSPNCDWYDVSCYLRWVWYTYGISLGGLIGTMEPGFDSNSYPNAVDWRDSGAVTNVRTQGSCGACWAITAVETIESAHYISTGQLYDLSETEIIACDDSCEMCSGGWPQNAYSWTMKYGGLPLSNSLGYNADTLLSMTYAMEGGDDDTKESLRSGMCPAGSSNEGSHDSNDENTYWEENVENENYGDYTDTGRYGNIKGYGYATDRCLCYTDGSGCDCDDQDEDLAVRNLATYGPAVVCIEASLWQDYSGGIITTDLGCGQEFLDMNHCVQVVGYAFTTDSDQQQQDGEGDEDGNDGGNDEQRSNDNKSGSNDENGQREGYWIVRNQWGTSWGMNGYAYVAMGANTCGVLNDMTQAYL